MQAYVLEMTWVRFLAIVISALIVIGGLAILAGIGIYHALIENGAGR